MEINLHNKEAFIKVLQDIHKEINIIEEFSSANSEIQHDF